MAPHVYACTWCAATSFASARSGLLSFADGIVPRIASGDADGPGGLVLGTLRTQAAGPVLRAMTTLSAFIEAA
jgi:hypothetical protein